MATATISCPTCQKQFAFKPELAGKKVKCPKCGNAFVVAAPGGGGKAAGTGAKAPAGVAGKGPAAQEYDLAPEAPRKAETPRYEVQYVEPAAPAKTYPTAGQEAASVLATTARLGARHGVVGLVGGVVGGGLIMVIRRKPKLFLWGFIGLGALLVTCLGTGAIVHFFFRPGFHAPAPGAGPGAMPPGVPAAAGGATTYESLVAKFGAEHVYRVKVTGSKNEKRDMLQLQAFVGGALGGGRNFVASSGGGTLEIAFHTDRPFEECEKAFESGVFYTFGTVDAEQRTITAAMKQP